MNIDQHYPGGTNEGHAATRGRFLSEGTTEGVSCVRCLMFYFKHSINKQQTAYRKKCYKFLPLMNSSCLSLAQLPPELQSVHNFLQRNEQSLRTDYLNKRSSHASDTSSAYSGSDLMQSSLDDQDIDFTGLRESQVDSDDEEADTSSEGVSETEFMPLTCRVTIGKRGLVISVRCLVKRRLCALWQRCQSIWLSFCVHV